MAINDATPSIGAGESLEKISGDLASDFDVNSFKELMGGAVGVTMFTSGVSADANAKIAVATTVKDTFAKVR